MASRERNVNCVSIFIDLACKLVNERTKKNAMRFQIVVHKSIEKLPESTTISSTHRFSQTPTNNKVQLFTQKENHLSIFVKFNYFTWSNVSIFVFSPLRWGKKRHNLYSAVAKNASSFTSKQHTKSQFNNLFGAHQIAIKVKKKHTSKTASQPNQ